MNIWIPVEKELPKNEDKVLCCTVTQKGRKNFVMGYYSDGRWCCGMNSNVVAWMPVTDPEDKTESRIKWIPVEERLPDTERAVLVTIYGSDCIVPKEGETLLEAVGRLRRELRYVTVGHYAMESDAEDNKWMDWLGPDWYPLMVSPVAWAELPEAWEAEQ